MDMQCVILAGGLATRLRPLTEKIPKPLVPINGRPFIHHQLKLLKSYGIANILILTGYLGKQIEDYLGDGSKLGLGINYSYEENPLGTGGSLKNAETMLKEAFLIVNGDTYLNLDYKELIDYFYKRDKIGVMTVYSDSEKIAPNNVKIDETNLVMGYNKKDDATMDCVDSGVMVFKKKIINFIEPGRKISLEEDIFSRLIENKELVAYPVKQRFYDIGTFEGLKLLEGILK